jgi:putative FmdB family regulatory protein
MPLFNFKCGKCDIVFERFMHASKEDVICEKCGEICEKIFSVCGNRVELNSKDLYEQQIMPDAKRMMDNMRNGKDSDFCDVYGEE